MSAPGSALDWEGQTVLDRDGDKIGKIEEIYLVEDTGEPEWALVKVGRLKGHTTLVPLTKARPGEKGVEIAVDKEVVSEAPEIKPDAEPSEQQVNALYRHYGLANGSSAPESSGSNGQAAPAPSAGASPQDPRDEPIGELLSTVKEEGANIVGQELKLAKAEMTEKVKDVGIGAGMFGGAGYVANLAALAFMLTLIFALAEAMAPWLAALIVTVLFGAGAAALALMGKKKIQQAGPPIPEQTVESVKQTIETVKEGAAWGLGQTK
jgi:sporulation protein YlmC with PRC-barrel domain